MFLRPAFLWSIVTTVGLIAVVRPLSAEDWPMYGHDIARSQITTERIAPPLARRWVFQPRYAPAAAWSDPRPADLGEIVELRRAHFDDAFQVAVAGGAVYFGSSAENKVVCLDVATGRVRWTKITGGPVRLAPSVAEGRVYFGSDDGYAYCLDAADGSLVWQFHAAPEDRHVLGHGRMISLWPLRTGVLVDGPVAYFGAGVFPAEGVFLYAVDARSGREIWRNDSGGEAPQSRVSPQGYLLASRTTLYAPMGRASPASFDRADGRLVDQTFFGKTVGGAYALLAGERVYTGTEEMVAYRQDDTKDRFAIFEGRKLVVTGDAAYLTTGSRLMAIARKSYPAASQRAAAARSRRTALAEVLYRLKQDRAQLLKDIARLDDAVAAAERPADTAKQAGLPSPLDVLRSELADKERALGGWPARYEQEQVKLAALDDELTQAQRALDALYLWNIPCRCDQTLILAGDVLVAGGNGQVVAIAAASGQTLWTASVEGSAKGLAAAGGALLVSTDKGLIYCFGEARGDRPTAPVAPDHSADNVPRSRGFSPQVEYAAETILRQSGIRRGYCLVLGCETGELAVELARRSELMIYAVSPDAAKVAAARQAVDAAGMYGARVCVERWPLDHVPYADYFANLVVSETALAGGSLPPDPGEMFRMLKPIGGIALFGRPADAHGSGAGSDREGLARWLARSGLEGRVESRDGNWVQIVRGPLRGAGSWTHLYANPGNTACGDDQRVKSPLGVLWFGHPGPGSMVNRHNRSVAPLAIDGRLFCQGENVLMAYDAYNGLELWTRRIRGALRTGVSRDCGNLAVNHQSLFAAINARCLRIDPATGATLATYRLPETAGTGDSDLLCEASGTEGALVKPSRQEAPVPFSRTRWGYVGLLDDLLIGSCTAGGGMASGLFAVEPQAGKRLWTYRGKAIAQTSISLGDGQVFFLDSDVTDEQRRQALEGETRRIAGLPAEDRAAAEKVLPKADVRRVVAIDARSGRLRWQVPLNLSSCSGGAVGTMFSGGKLVVFGIFTDGHDWQRFFVGQFASRRVTVLSGEDGKLLWSRAIGYRVRPLIVGDTLHAEPWAFDLGSGAPRTRINPITGQSDLWQFARPGHHCGCPSASPNCLFFRSYSLGYYDLTGDFGTQHFGGQRPGCWINFIPAAGLMMMPEASAGCMCPFPNVCSVVFEPTQKLKGFGFYSAAGPLTPVRRIAINLGAPGDRNDAAGQLWLGYPRPSGSLGLPLNLDVAFCPGGGFVNRNSAYTVTSGTDDPWLFASAAKGLTRCTIPLLEPRDGVALYRVRLAMADPDNSRPGQRVFDIKLQGKRAAANCDIVRETGGPNRALIKEFPGIEVAGPLILELVPKAAGTLTPRQMPILQGLEVLRQRVVRLGYVLPRFQVNNREPSQSGEIELTNLSEQTFRGTLEIAAPPGFVATPQHMAVELASGTHRKIALALRALTAAPAGVHSVGVRLLRADRGTEFDTSTTIEHLGRMGRLVIVASEDAFVTNRYPDLNKGDATVLVVNGGENVLGDIDHTLAYVKFRLNVPGRPTRLRLRLTNAGDPTFDAGRICLVEGPWEEKQITYANRPALGPVLARVGPVVASQVVEILLDPRMAARKELSLALDPSSCDSVDYVSREGGKPPELVIDYEQE